MRDPQFPVAYIHHIFEWDSPHGQEDVKFWLFCFRNLILVLLSIPLSCVTLQSRIICHMFLFHVCGSATVCHICLKPQVTSVASFSFSSHMFSFSFPFVANINDVRAKETQDMKVRFHVQMLVAGCVNQQVQNSWIHRSPLVTGNIHRGEQSGLVHPTGLIVHPWRSGWWFQSTQLIIWVILNHVQSYSIDVQPFWDCFYWFF